MRHSFSIIELCHALGVSRSGYHAAATRLPGPRAKSNSQLIARMTSLHGDRHTRSYSSPRMTRELPTNPPTPSLIVVFKTSTHR